jgi:ribosomal protein L13
MIKTVVTNLFINSQIDVALARIMLKNMKVFAGTDHPYADKKPATLHV